MNDSYGANENSLLSQFDFASALTTLMPLVIITSIVIFGLLIVSVVRQHQQRQQQRQMQKDISAIRELLEKRFGDTTTYSSRQAPLNKELASDPQLPPRP